MLRPTTDPENDFVDWLEDKFAINQPNRQELIDASRVDSGRLSKIMNRKMALSFEAALQLAPHLGFGHPLGLLVKAQLIEEFPGLTSRELELTAYNKLLNEDGQELLLLIAGTLQKRFPTDRTKRSDASK